MLAVSRAILLAVCANTGAGFMSALFRLGSHFLNLRPHNGRTLAQSQIACAGSGNADGWPGHNAMKMNRLSAEWRSVSANFRISGRSSAREIEACKDRFLTLAHFSVGVRLQPFCYEVDPFLRRKLDKDTCYEFFPDQSAPGSMPSPPPV
jgi:hypothetical protein